MSTAELIPALDGLPDWILYMILGRASVFMQLPDFNRGLLIVEAARLQSVLPRLFTAYQQVTQEHQMWKRIMEADAAGTLDILEQLADPNAPSA